MIRGCFGKPKIEPIRQCHPTTSQRTRRGQLRGPRDDMLNQRINADFFRFFIPIRFARQERVRDVRE